MKKFEFNVENLEHKSEKNLNYNKLYEFIAKEKKVDTLTKAEKKVYRTLVQSEKIDDTLCYALIYSGFVDKNKSNPKFKTIQPIIDKFNETYKI